MKVTKNTVWSGAIVAAAIAVAVVLLSRREDHLTVHLVDRSKNPISASVTVWEGRTYPFLGSMNFLPQWARGSMRSNSMNVVDGVVKVRPVRGPRDNAVLLVRTKLQPSEIVVFVHGQTNGAVLVVRYPQSETHSREPIKPEETEVTVILE